jgi:hypothetical protein
VTTYYWWAKKPHFLPRPNGRRSHCQFILLSTYQASCSHIELIVINCNAIWQFYCTGSHPYNINNAKTIVNLHQLKGLLVGCWIRTTNRSILDCPLWRALLAGKLKTHFEEVKDSRRRVYQTRFWLLSSTNLQQLVLILPSVMHYSCF